MWLEKIGLCKLSDWKERDLRVFELKREIQISKSNEDLALTDLIIKEEELTSIHDIISDKNNREKTLEVTIKGLRDKLSMLLSHSR